MTRTKPLTPSRKLLLEAQYKCVLRAEKRIVCAGHIANNARIAGPPLLAQSKAVQTIARHMRAGLWERYAISLGLLRLARSKITAELEGLPWR